MNGSKERLNYISNVRIIGILLVVLGHSYPFQVDIPWVLSIFRNFIYCFHMPLFIFLSAFLVTKTQSIERHGIKTYLKNRTVRMLTPYIVLTLICFVPKILMSAYINDTVKLSLLYFVRTIFVPRDNVWGHFWFLPVIWIFAIISVAFERLIYKNKRLACLVCVLSFGLLFVTNVTVWFGINDIKNNLCWYLLGMILGSSEKSNITTLRGYPILAVSIVLFVVEMLVDGIPNAIVTAMNIAIAFCMILGLLIVCSKYDFTKIRLLKTIEKNSFSVFILSWPFQVIVEIVMNRILSLPVFVVTSMMFASGIFGPLVITWMIRLVEKKCKKTICYKTINYIEMCIGM